MGWCGVDPAEASQTHYAKWPREALGEEPLHWSGKESASDWRQIILDCLSKDIDAAACMDTKEFRCKYEGE